MRRLQFFWRTSGVSFVENIIDGFGSPVRAQFSKSYGYWLTDCGRIGRMRREMNGELNQIKDCFVASTGFQRMRKTVNEGNSFLWNGCTGSSYALIGGCLADHTKRSILLVLPNVGDVERAAEDMAFFTDASLMTYPVLSETANKNNDDLSLIADDNFGKRLRVLKHFDEGNSKPVVVVTSLAAIIQSIPSQSEISTDSIHLEIGSEFGRDKLICWLNKTGFTSVTAVELPNEYSIRGDIVDIFAKDWERPVRIEFFGDEIDSIRNFNVVSQLSEEIDRLDSIDVTSISASGSFESRFTDRLPGDLLVLIVETSKTISETTRLLSTSLGEASATLVNETMNALYRRPTIHCVSIATGSEFAHESYDGQFVTVDKLQGDFSHVEKTLKTLKNEDVNRVFIVCGSETEQRRMETTFENHDPGLKGLLSFPVGSIKEGFEWLDASLKMENSSSENEDYPSLGSVVFIGSDQLFGRVISRRTRSGSGNKKALSRSIDSFMELKVNDYVVHEDFGVAQYKGMTTIMKSNQIEESLNLEFAGNVVVSIPASHIYKVQRYVGVAGYKVKLSKYGGKAWTAKKTAAMKSIMAYAQEMLELEAIRDSLEGYEFPEDGDFLRDFETAFPYRETPDQLTAIEDIKKDMESRRPMDRLLCGDVGFGKTEVAFRAVIKAVEGGRQAAILAPTTVLVEQHYATLLSRAASLPLTVGTLSRYSSPSEQAETLKKLASGQIDVVIGTHRLLSKDVEFKRLGLVVIDEEQRFGVKHKDRLKQLRSEVDILTMTATPIPRTLHFSLIGARDISKLETPPEDRLPVETKVTRFSEEKVRLGILRELNRGGQVYFLHNKVKDIEEVADMLRKLVPEARIRVGHAQMSAEELEETMRNFVRHSFDVLVCTTIIESGLDIPNANTMFIDNANNFGLAELHQLRGRVGREKKQAYCYFMIDPDVQLSTQSLQRLEAIREYNKLGAGFQIARRDLQIRGAGNILGTEQSGHLAEVGYEMYCDMLEAAKRALKNEKERLRNDVEIDLPIVALLGESFISDPETRIDLYRRFSRVEKKDDADLLRSEMKDRFGCLPVEAIRFYRLAIIRTYAFEFRVKKIQMVTVENLTVPSRMLEIQFRDSARKELLRLALKEKGIELRLLAGTINGYVDLPRDLYDREGRFKQENLLDFVENLFTTEALISDEQLEITEAAKRQIRTIAKKNGDARPCKKNEAPLAAKRRQLKSENDPTNLK